MAMGFVVLVLVVLASLAVLVLIEYLDVTLGFIKNISVAQGFGHIFHLPDE